MSIFENWAKNKELYARWPKKDLFELNCQVRDALQQRNPILDFVDFPKSKFKAPGIKHCFLIENQSILSLFVLEPHNFPEVCHLNLEESFFVHFRIHNDLCRLELPLVLRREIRFEFDETCKRKMAKEPIRRMAEIPHAVFRLVKSFLNFAKISKISECYKEDEKLFVSEKLLRAMYLQEQELGSDGNLTVEILKTFCSSDECKTRMFISGYSYQLLNYVFRCCSEVQFDIERYLTSFCPVTRCIITPLHEFGRLRILLQHGFEIQGHTLREYRFRDGKRSHWREVLYDGFLTQLSSRRQNILLFFLHIANASLRQPQWEWVDAIKLVFNSIPDPYICEPELRLHRSHSFRQFLLTHFKGSYVTSYSPRKLKHLSRCVIRKVLKVNFEIPDGIDALPLPPALQSYLKHLGD